MNKQLYYDVVQGIFVTEKEISALPDRYIEYLPSCAEYGYVTEKYKCNGVDVEFAYDPEIIKQSLIPLAQQRAEYLKMQCASECLEYMALTLKCVEVPNTMFNELWEEWCENDR